MTPEESRALLADVRSNLALRDACQRPHEFGEIKLLERRVRCSKCGSWFGSLDAMHYRDGRDDMRDALMETLRLARGDVSNADTVAFIAGRLGCSARFAEMCAPRAGREA